MSEIYGTVDGAPILNVYKLLLENHRIPSDDTTTFISLNYDLILERALTRANTSWHYAHVSTTGDCDQDGIEVIKPHGSLNWLFKGNVPVVSITTNCQLTSVVHQSFLEDQFEEALIIPPTHLKQPLNTPETQAADTRKLLSKLWKRMAKALKDASHVFIIGYSFPSTDHHLRTLFYQVNHRREGRKYHEVHCCIQGCQREVFESAERFSPRNNSNAGGEVLRTS